MNVDGDAEGLAELARLGVRVPAVVAGERVVQGWNPAGYAALLGIDYRAPERLAPRALAARLDRVLAAAEGLVARVPVEQLRWAPPERNRTIRDLAYHLFRLALAYADAMDRGELPEGWLGERAPAELDDGPAIARYGALVRRRLAGWFEGASDAAFGQTVQVYYGPDSGHGLLERTTWHGAQHLRQLYALAERLGITPAEPLPADALLGLPLPDALW